jgi:hypothetical protein
MHRSANTLPNIRAGSKLINVIVKEVVLVQDTGMSINVFLIHVCNFYVKHFDLMKTYDSLYKFYACFTRGIFHLIIPKADR